MKNIFLTWIVALILGTPNLPVNLPIDPKPEVLASSQMSMEYRYPVASVSKIFKENLLLNLAYMDGRVTNAKDINWTEVVKPFSSEFTLKPTETFAFHNAVLPEYKDSVVVTTKARFNQQDGFKTDGYLYGDGVCQLASFINMAARDASLEVVQYTNHDFAAIPEVPKQYGVAIYLDPNNLASSGRKNLYVTNNQDKPVTFRFDYDGVDLKVTVSKA